MPPGGAVFIVGMPPIRVANRNRGYAMNARASDDPRPIIPALGQHYAFTSDLAYLVVRVTVGLTIFWHGWIKVTAMNHAGLTGYFAKLGLEPAGLYAYLVPLNETVGALLITIGLFTRPAAVIMIIEFIVLNHRVYRAHPRRSYPARLRHSGKWSGSPAIVDGDAGCSCTAWRRSLVNGPQDRPGNLGLAHSARYSLDSRSAGS